MSRWYNHIKSFSKAEQSKFPGVKPSGSVPAKKEEEDDDDVDLFGSDDEEVSLDDEEVENPAFKLSGDVNC